MTREELQVYLASQKNIQSKRPSTRGRKSNSGALKKREIEEQQQLTGPEVLDFFEMPKKHGVYCEWISGGEAVLMKDGKSYTLTVKAP